MPLPCKVRICVSYSLADGRELIRICWSTGQHPQGRSHRIALIQYLIGSLVLELHKIFFGRSKTPPDELALDVESRTVRRKGVPYCDLSRPRTRPLLLCLPWLRVMFQQHILMLKHHIMDHIHMLENHNLFS
jgi:hypothetical protein